VEQVGRDRPVPPIPIGWVIDEANRNDSILAEPTVQAVDRGLLLDIETLHLDRGYDATSPPTLPGPGAHRHRLRQEETQGRSE
jgi:hypothetical protein